MPALLVSTLLLFVILDVEAANPEMLSKSVSQHNEDETRLPTSLRPVKYKLQLMPYMLDGQFTVDGKVWITITCINETNMIVLNIYDIVIYTRQLSVIEQTNNRKSLSVTSTEVDKRLQFFNIHVEEPLIPERIYVLFMKFQGKMYDEGKGFFRRKYRAPIKNEQRWLVMSHLPPTEARRAFPCFDEPAFKATFQITLARKTNLSTLSNMPLLKTVPVSSKPGWVWDIYQESVPMSTYLVSFIVSDLKCFDTNYLESSNKLNFKVCSREEELSHTQYAGYVGPRMLEFFEKYFNVTYALPKEDMIAVPGLDYDAMENWGLISFRESQMLFDANTSAEKTKQDIAQVIGHEIAHQWFGNLVTHQWWNDLWLTEGFATFISYFATDFIEPSWRVRDQLLVDTFHGVMVLDSLESSHPVSFGVDQSASIITMFDKITYEKGASIIRMMSHFLGNSTFRYGLSKYLDKYKFGNAQQDDLWNSLTLQAYADRALPRHLSVKLIMDTWTLQTGYPVVSAERDYTTGLVHIQQERFLSSRRENASSNVTNITWYVPITYTTKVNPDFKTTQPQRWLDNKPSMKIFIPLSENDWFLLNIKETGFYRVNYDRNNWQLLITDFDSLPDMTRAQLLDDSFHLAAADYLEYDIPLQLMSQLKTDVNFFTWNVAMKNIQYLTKMLAHSDVYQSFKIFVLDILDQVYTDLGYDERPTDTHLDILNRRNVIGEACKSGHEECIEKSKMKFRMWMNNRGKEEGENLSKLSPNQVATLYCTGIGYGGQEEWNFVWNVYIGTDDEAEKEKFLLALACSSDPPTLERFLHMTLNESLGIRRESGRRVFAHVASNKDGSSVAFNFINTNWKKLLRFYGEASSSISLMVPFLGVYMNTPGQLAQLKEFCKKNYLTLGAAERSFNQTIEEVEGHIGWMKNNYRQVKNWLLKYKTS